MWTISSYYSVFTTVMSIIPSIFDENLFLGGAQLGNGLKTIYNFPASRIAAANAIADDHFPPDFLFGVGTSAYQVEGAWNVSDKSPSIWDTFTHEHPELIRDHKNGDIAADSYHKYKEDVKLVGDLGANAYRISLSWSRILPNGYSNRISTTGVAYYNNLINEMLKSKIKPVVTIFHWDLPTRFQDMGGWTNPLIVDWFVEYARVVFDLFGDRVKMWATLNEPMIFCTRGYAENHAPRIEQSGYANYICGHYALLAHAKAYRMYELEYAHKQNGKVGIVMSLAWPTPQHSWISEEVLGADRYFQFWNGWFMNPIFSKTGDYPEIMRARIDENSKIQGFKKSRLPVFTADEIEMIKGSADYLGANFYSATRVRLRTYNSTSISYYDDIGTERLPQHKQLFDEQSTPWALAKLLHAINVFYKIPMIYITENGYGDQGQLFDIGRTKYHHQHLMELLRTMHHGADVRGYFAWSLIDNFEWTHGYARHYGLYKVYFDDPNLKRTAKLSTKVVGDIYRTSKIPKLAWSLEEVPFYL